MAYIFKTLQPQLPIFGALFLIVYCIAKLWPLRKDPDKASTIWWLSFAVLMLVIFEARTTYEAVMLRRAEEAQRLPVLREPSETPAPAPSDASMQAPRDTRPSALH